MMVFSPYWVLNPVIASTSTVMLRLCAGLLGSLAFFLRLLVCLTFASVATNRLRFGAFNDDGLLDSIEDVEVLKET